MFLPQVLRPDMDECTALAEATLNVQRQFGVVINPKLAAVLALGGVAAGVYMPKLAAAAQMARQRKQAQREAADLTGFGGGAPSQPWEGGPVPAAPTEQAAPTGDGGEFIIPTGVRVTTLN